MAGFRSSNNYDDEGDEEDIIEVLRNQTLEVNESSTGRLRFSNVEHVQHDDDIQNLVQKLTEEVQKQKLIVNELRAELSAVRRSSDEQIEGILDIIRPINSYLDMINSKFDDKTRSLLTFDKMCLGITLGFGTIKGYFRSDLNNPLTLELETQIKSLEKKFDSEMSNLYSLIGK